MPEALLRPFVDEYSAGCSEQERARVLREIEEAQRFCASRTDPYNPGIGLNSIPPSYAEHLQKLRNSRMFQLTIGAAANFGVMDMRNVIAVQPNVKTEEDDLKKVPSNPTFQQLLDTCLPHLTTFTLDMAPTDKGFVFSGFDNNLVGANLVLQPGQAPMIYPVSRGNWVQVGRVKNRCFLRNGYHRVTKFLEDGVNELPCVFQDFGTEQEMGLQGRFFDLAYLSTATRPPLMRDFNTKAAVNLPGRRMRTGLAVAVTLEGHRFEVPG